MPTLAEGAREAMAVDRCAASPALERCLEEPMAALDRSVSAKLAPAGTFEVDLGTWAAATTNG